MGAVGWKTRVSLEKMKTFCIKSAGVNLDCMLRADTIKYKWLCTFIRAGTLSALMRLRKLTFSCSKIKGILKAPRPYRLLLSTKKKTFISRVSKRKHINVDGNAVEPPGSDHPKSEHFNSGRLREVVAYEKCITAGVSSEKCF